MTHIFSRLRLGPLVGCWIIFLRLRDTPGGEEWSAGISLALGEEHSIYALRVTTCMARDLARVHHVGNVHGSQSVCLERRFQGLMKNRIIELFACALG